MVRRGRAGGATSATINGFAANVVCQGVAQNLQSPTRIDQQPSKQEKPDGIQDRRRRDEDGEGQRSQIR
jgi:hypothetical protein